MNITVTESAEIYLAELLEKQNVEGIAVRMFVTQPGTPYAETCLAYCRPDEIVEDDAVMPMEKVTFYFEKNSLPYLEEATVDFATDRMGGQLTIKAPNAKVPNVSDDSPIEEQINYILYSDINPGLSSHGGEVKLIELIEESNGQVAILQFGGGCQGCSAVDMTLKDGVEKTLVERVSGLVGVRDVTDHTVTDNAYYK
ncbi:Fe-S biogenesis protein NfuA [Amphritea sp. 2_MG-2023]|uniref:Fe-S biogenesis protein NfuA n=1 Tax=Amphritea TaxID=515417 RepID=UPI001C06A352|nr:MULTISPECIES: Fe-S biogenesis protein NfuA [Amphritea]MBU2966511.1 Fe-S biogenesis protein NfuA [Amphritea atlantica]MDO6417630.1 Fe-S biogenesis protein NfuA [Amphritea sp. 2_MG-2023]MDX2423573.1 Fe-S biogenesis protein NfuA [Amphritea sp.]